MKFKSPSHDHSVNMALTSGHTFVVPALKDAPDGVEVPAMFQREAVARGAEPMGLEPMPAEVRTMPNKAEVITKALQVMLDGNEESDFKKDGTPDLNAVARRCGFKVQREEVDAIWTQLRESVS